MVPRTLEDVGQDRADVAVMPRDEHFQWIPPIFDVGNSSRNRKI
jgi:hypothetical protein